MGSTSTTTRTSVKLASLARVTSHSPPMLVGSQEPLLFTNMGAGEADLVFNLTEGVNETQNTFLANKPAATAMRAPGAMQSALFAGAVIDHFANAVGNQEEEIMELNFYQVEDKSCVYDVVFEELISAARFRNSWRKSCSQSQAFGIVSITCCT